MTPSGPRCARIVARRAASATSRPAASPAVEQPPEQLGHEHARRVRVRAPQQVLLQARDPDVGEAGAGEQGADAAGVGERERTLRARWRGGQRATGQCATAADVEDA